MLVILTSKKIHDKLAHLSGSRASHIVNVLDIKGKFYSAIREKELVLVIIGQVRRKTKGFS